MVRSEFEEAKNSFDYSLFESRRKKLYKELDKFVKRYTPNAILKLSLREYVQGHGCQDTFTYHVERTFDELGTISGSYCSIFGIFYSKNKSQYSFPPKWGDTPKAALKSILESIVDLIEAGAERDTQRIIDNQLAPMYKGKLLSLYYPDDYLNIFSDDHLKYYLKFFNQTSEGVLSKDSVLKRERLVEFKEKDPIMKNWTMDQFATFLYSKYPGAPKKEDNTREESTFEQYSIADLSLIDLDYKQEDKESRAKNSGRRKVDYAQEQRRNTILGGRGESIVMDYERKRLKAAKIRKVPVQVSADSDSCGYDILSYNEDGSKRYIEVKATTSGIGPNSFYYTENERQKAIEYDEAYHIYMVLSVKSKKPKIWDMGNPFLSNPDFKLTPVTYKAEFVTFEK